MARKKISDDEKKSKIGLTIDIELLSLLEQYIENLNINRSKYIENLIKEDLINRRIEIKNKYE